MLKCLDMLELPDDVLDLIDIRTGYPALQTTCIALNKRLQHPPVQVYVPPRVGLWKFSFYIPLIVTNPSTTLILGWILSFVVSIYIVGEGGRMSDVFFLAVLASPVAIEAIEVFFCINWQSKRYESCVLLNWECNDDCQCNCILYYCGAVVALNIVFVCMALPASAYASFSRYRSHRSLIKDRGFMLL